MAATAATTTPTARATSARSSARATRARRADKTTARARRRDDDGDDDGRAAAESDGAATSEDIGAAIRAAKEAKADDGANIFAGAAEEVGLIEWPTAGGALSTTALVMAGIFGSAGVLLGVNAVLSELSQKLFP